MQTVYMYHTPSSIELNTEVQNTENMQEKLQPLKEYIEAAMQKLYSAAHHASSLSDEGVSHKTTSFAVSSRFRFE